MSQLSASDTLSAAPMKLPNSEQMVLDALVVRRRHGVDKVTAGELRVLLEQIHAPRRFDKGWVTGRLSELEDRGLVEPLEESRLDPSTKRSSQLWQLPLTQARLCA